MNHHTFTPPPRDEVAGVDISLTTYDQVLTAIEVRPEGRSLTVAFCNVHSVMTARRNPALQRALGHFDFATADGMPLVWWLRLRHPAQERVYGPDLMEAALSHGLARGWSHYFYGSTEPVLGALCDAAQNRAPGVRIVGRCSPPFRTLATHEEDSILAEIRAAKPDVLWVGLGMPKQELWVDRVADRLPGIAVMAVGAAFDLLSGTVPQAPDRIQDLGLEWAYRLVQEPSRLWRRYLTTNPPFAVLLAREWLHTRLER